MERFRNLLGNGGGMGMGGAAAGTVSFILGQLGLAEQEYTCFGGTLTFSCL
jgi:26S proteasome regulatory subunit N11